MSELYHHIVNCETGEETLVPLTKAEIAAREAARLEVGEAILPAPVDLLAEVRALRAEVDALKAGKSGA